MSLSFGSVSITPTGKPPASKSGLRVSAVSETSRFPATPYGIEATANGLSRPLAAVSAHGQAAASLQAEVARRLAAADRKEVVVFIHGYGNSFDDAALTTWLQGKPAKGQVLVIAASDLEAKNPFVKLVKDKGRALEFKVAGKLKDLDLGQFATETLAPYKKKMGPGALDLLKERVGGNYRLLGSELTKLALYTDSDVISKKDVDLLVGHAREDEFFELSDAIQKRNFDAAMKYVADALGQGAHPLMMLGSVASIVRTMLSNFERMRRLSDGKPPRNYNDFQARLWPKIEAEAKANKQKVPHPYASFMGMQASMGYGRQELLRGLVACAEADLALKLGGEELVLERLLWTLCGKAAAWDSQMHQIRREQER